MLTLSLIVFLVGLCYIIGGLVLEEDAAVTFGLLLFVLGVIGYFVSDEPSNVADEVTEPIEVIDTRMKNEYYDAGFKDGAEAVMNGTVKVDTIYVYTPIK